MLPPLHPLKIEPDSDLDIEYLSMSTPILIQCISGISQTIKSEPVNNLDNSNIEIITTIDSPITIKETASTLAISPLPSSVCKVKHSCIINGDDHDNMKVLISKTF